MKGCRHFYTTLPWEKKTSSATGRYWIGFTTNATSTSKNVAQYRDEAERLLDDEKITPKWQRPSYMPHAPH